MQGLLHWSQSDSSDSLHERVTTVRASMISSSRRPVAVAQAACRQHMAFPSSSAWISPIVARRISMACTTSSMRISEIVARASLKIRSGITLPVVPAADAVGAPDTLDGLLMVVGSNDDDDDDDEQEDAMLWHGAIYNNGMI